MLGKFLLKSVMALNLCFGVMAFAAEQPLDNGSKAKIVQEYNDLYANQSGFLATCGFLVADQTNMPTLYAMISNLTKKLEIEVPWVLIFQGNVLWNILEACGEDYRANALGVALYHNFGVICIGEDLIKGEMFTAAGLEAVIAHELSHVYHNHLVKSLVLSWVVKKLVFNMIRPGHTIRSPFSDGPVEIWSVDVLVYVLIARAICRFYEKEADMTASRIINDPNALGQVLDAIEKNFREKPHAIYDFVTELFIDHPLTKHRKAYLEQTALEKAAA